jgi:hypothetical protein
VVAPDWLQSSVPVDRDILHARIRLGIIYVAERRGHDDLATGLRLLADVSGFLWYATGRMGHVTAHAAALWNMWQPESYDEVLMDLLDTCVHLLEPGKAPDYWADFLATVRGALAS